MKEVKSIKFNFIMNLIRVLMTIVFPLITYPYATRVLNSAGVGRAAYVASIVSYFQLVASFGVNNYAITEGAKIRDDKAKLNKFASEMFFINLVFTVLAYIGFAGALFLPKFDGYEMLLLISSSTILFTTLGMEWLYELLEEYEYITIRSVIFQVVALVMLFVLVRNEGDVAWYVALTAVSTVGSGVLNFIHSRHYIHLFETRRGRLEYRANRDYVRNGIASIPCRISDYSDVISTYSVKEYETLNPDFVDYIKSTAEVTPPEYPLVLNIIGNCLSPEEQHTIESIIGDDFAYDLGLVEKEENRHTKTFYLMFFGLVLSGLLLWLTLDLADLPRELLYILFWFTGDTLCDYIFLTGYELRRERRLAGRLASIRVVFSESYHDPNYTESDVEKLYTEIEKDVNETIREEENE